MVLHVNQAPVLVIRNWFYASERVFCQSSNLQRKLMSGLLK